MNVPPKEDRGEQHTSNRSSDQASGNANSLDKAGDGKRVEYSPLRAQMIPQGNRWHGGHAENDPDPRLERCYHLRSPNDRNQECCSDHVSESEKTVGGHQQAQLQRKPVMRFRCWQRRRAVIVKNQACNGGEQ